MQNTWVTVGAEVISKSKLEFRLPTRGPPNSLDRLVVAENKIKWEYHTPIHAQ